MANSRNSNGPIVGVFALAGVLSVAAAITGVMADKEGLLAGGVLGVIVLLVGVGVVLARRQASQQATPSAAASLPRLDLEPLLASLEQIRQNTLLTDEARRVLFHDRDLQMIHDALETDLAHGDLASAQSLCQRVESVLQLPDEADRMRSRIAEAQQMQSHAALADAMHTLNAHLAARDWAAAHAEAGRLKQQYPQAAMHFDQQILRARDQHKQALLAQFDDAASSHDAERAMQLMHELDRFLSPDEAAALAQTAQQVIAEHRENIGTAFKLAVSEKRWADAARQGELIIQSYPNTKMAAEVRGMIEMVRTRATEAALSAEEAAR